APASIPSDDFTIRFYDDNAGVPGALLHEENVGEVGRVKSGLVTTINSVDEYLYITRIEMPPTVQNGLTYWVSIENDLAGTGNVWGWMTSGVGDGISAVSVLGGPFAAGALNLSVLLSTDTSTTGNTHLFQSKWYDPGTRLYYNNARYLDPQTGRFISRDPLGLFGDAGNLGNAYTYAGNNPYTLVDSSGFMPGPTPGRNGGPPMFGSPSNSPTSPTTPAPSPPKLPTTEDGPRLPGTGRPSKPVPAEKDYLDEMLRRSLERLRHQWGSSAGYGYGGGIYSPPGVASGAASKGNSSGSSNERCDGADDDCGTACGSGFGSGDSSPYGGGCYFPSSGFDYTDFEIPDSWKAKTTPYGADGLPYAPAIPTRLRDIDPARWGATVTPYGADGKRVRYRRGRGIPVADWADSTNGCTYTRGCDPPRRGTMTVTIPMFSDVSGMPLSNPGTPRVNIGGDLMRGESKPTFINWFK
ncbi:MAG: RHS repeat-associated core domain-containing protein, partial [Planctomycetota bacterium]